MQALQNQVVLVTGCSSGIGYALAGELRARGHRVFAGARRVDAIAKLAASGIETLALDVTDLDSIHTAVAQVIEKAGHIDVLINNAGVNAFGPLLELPLPE